MYTENQNLKSETYMSIMYVNICELMLNEVCISPRLCFPPKSPKKKGKTHVVHSQSDFECFFFLGDSCICKNAGKNENQEFDVCLRRHISSFTGGSAVIFGSLQCQCFCCIRSLCTKRVLLWKVVHGHNEIHEIC